MQRECNSQMDHDKGVSKQRTYQDNENLNTLLTETHCSKVKVNDVFVLKNCKQLFRCFWVLLKKATKDVIKLKKNAVLANSRSYKTSLPRCLALVVWIPKGKKINTISTKGCRAILKQVKANGNSLFVEFIKVGESKLLKQRE